MQAKVHETTLIKLVEEVRLAAGQCPKCEGTRETVFTARGRDNVVNCLECENVHQALGHLEAALKLLQEG